MVVTAVLPLLQLWQLVMPPLPPFLLQMTRVQLVVQAQAILMSCCQGVAVTTGCSRTPAMT